MAPRSDAVLTPVQLATAVKASAKELGFQSCGITDLSPPPHGDALRQWLDNGMAGTMRYMHRQATRRLEPALIWPEATRAIVVTRGYDAPTPTPDHSEPSAGGRVARYARGKDYHDALAPALENLARSVRTLGQSSGHDTTTRVYVDAGPVPERELAQRAGLGWIGKNTMLIDPGRGSYFFIATVLTDLDLAVDPPFELDRCGTCRRCLDACPTDAFPAERVLDSRLCISYLTIEYRGQIDERLEPAMGDWIFGCDVCQEVCPWNEKFSQPADDALIEHRPELATLETGEFEAMDDEAFHRRFGDTSFARTGLSGMRRNASIVERNRGRGRQDSG